MKKYNFEHIDGTFEVLKKALHRLQPQTAQAKFLAGHVEHILLLQNDLVFVKEGIISEIMPDMIFELSSMRLMSSAIASLLQKTRKNSTTQVS